jgi:hypothetical protein
MGDDHKRDELLDLVDDLDAGLEELRQAVNHLLDNLPWFVPDWVATEILEAWNDLCDDWDRDLNAWREDLEAMGEAWTLRGAADQWSTDVADKVSGLAGKIAAGPLQSDDVFAGAGANAYRGVIPGQGTAITNITGNFTTTLSDGLNETADAINEYDSAMIVAVIALIGALASAAAGVASSWTGVGAVVAIVAVIACLGTFVGAIITAETGIDNSAESVQGKWNIALGNWNGYDGEKWPNAVFPS